MIRPLVVSVCLGSVAVLTGASQTQAPPAFRSGVDLIELEVSVLDRDRNPVRGLTSADFTILDDGKPQRIAAFAAVDVPTSPPVSAAWMRDVAPDVQTNHEATRPDSRLFVILLDDALIPFDPAAIQSAKAIARRVIDQTAPSDRVAVVFSAGSGGTQNFTNDRRKLLAAIETLNPTYAVYTMGWNTARPPPPPGVVSPVPPGPAMDPDSNYRLASLRTLATVAESLAGAPQRRKVLVHISPGIIVDTASAATPVRGAMNVRMALREENSLLSRSMPNVYKQLRQANVNVYTVDPCGLGGLEQYVLGVVSQIPVLRMVTGPLPPGFDFLAPTQPPPPLFLSKHVSGLSRDFSLTTARNTGGFAIVDTNDFEPGLTRMFAENASYYVLGYPVPAGRRPGSTHEVSVRVKRPNTQVRARDHYTVPAASSPSREGPAPGPLARAVSGPVARADLRLRAAIAPVATARGSTVAIVLTLDLPAVAERTMQSVNLEYAIFTPDGQRRGAAQRDATFPLAPSSGPEPVPYDLLFDHALAPGRYEFRIAARRGSDSAVGSIYADVEVPDFAGAPLSLSGAFVQVMPLPPGGPRDAFAALVPAVPTTRREFATSDAVMAFVRVHQGGSTPAVAATVRVKILNQQGEVVTDRTQAQAPDQFAGAPRSADVGFQIPLAKLSPGSYLLGFDVTAGSHRAERTITFSVR